MVGPGDNQQLFVVAFQLLERVFAEVAGVRLFAVADEYGGADLVRVAEDGLVEEGHRAHDVPAAVGVERAGMIASFRLVVGMIVLDVEGRVLRDGIDHAAGEGVGAVLVVQRALGVEGPARLVAGRFAVRRIEIK